MLKKGSELGIRLSRSMAFFLLTLAECVCLNWILPAKLYNYAKSMNPNKIGFLCLCIMH